MASDPTRRNQRRGLTLRDDNLSQMEQSHCVEFPPLEKEEKEYLIREALKGQPHPQQKEILRWYSR